MRNLPGAKISLSQQEESVLREKQCFKSEGCVICDIISAVSVQGQSWLCFSFTHRMSRAHVGGR